MQYSGLDGPEVLGYQMRSACGNTCSGWGTRVTRFAGQTGLRLHRSDGLGRNLTRVVLTLPVILIFLATERLVAGGQTAGAKKG
jgi:hypothetical protein